MDAMDNFRRKFVEEASDLIDNLEATVLELEDRPTDSSIVQRVFRIMHTLKGNSSKFGFTQIDRFTHQMETIYDQIRSNEREVDSTVLDLTLRSVDHLRSLLRESGQESAEVMEEQEELMRVMSDIIAIHSVTDAFTGKRDGSLAKGRNAEIRGAFIKVVGDGVSVGVAFTKTDTGTRTLLDSHDIVINEPSRVLIMVPASLAAGTYDLSLTTQFTGSNKTLKNPRTVIYKTKITIA